MLLLILISLCEIFLRGILTYAHSSVYPKIFCVTRKVFLRYEDFRKHQSHLYEWDFQPRYWLTMISISFFLTAIFSILIPPPQIKLGGQSCVIAFLKLIVKGNIKKKFKGKKYIMVIDMPQIHWTQFLPFPGVATFDM